VRRSLLIVIACLQCGLDEIGLSKDGGPPVKDASSDLTVLLDASIDGASDAGDASFTDGSPIACPAGMKPVDNDFCIDATEVTVAQYALFTTLQVFPDAGSRCDYVTDLTPGALQGDVLEPQANIDWCDAYMYCEWAGKRLCGQRDGGALPSANPDKNPSNQWLAACSHDGTRVYCYPGAWDAGACNDDGITNRLEPVSTFPNCIGGFPGIYDMTGNAREWIDSCNADIDNGDSCVIMGGDYSNDHNGSVCTQFTTHNRDYTGSSTGFRCCWP
jgi:formylglycine-generating enzyme required for sulfatase activity